MLSQAISISRLRFYERECRRARATAGDALTKSELFSFEQLFSRAATENASQVEYSDEPSVAAE